jgi:hypothetical protein
VTLTEVPRDALMARCLVEPYGVGSPPVLRGEIDPRNGDGVYFQDEAKVVLVPAPRHGDYTLAHEVAHHVDTVQNGRKHRIFAHRYSWQDIYREMADRVPACRAAVDTIDQG